MTGLAGRALVLSLSRFANYGLMLLSPIILVRLLSIDDFGRYREFVLYSSLLQAIAGFGISASLLYFIPSHRESVWRIVKVAVLLTLFSSVAVMGAVVVADMVFDGVLVGEHRWPLALYVLFFVNLDFWEYLWLGNKRALAVLAYSVGRLATRLLVVIGIAALTANVKLMIWSLCILEGVRIAISFFVWRAMDRSREEPVVPGLWGEQLRFSLPAGFAALIFMANRNIGNVAVTKILGVAALAQYSIGLYGEPILLALRTSVSSVLLPEMVSRSGQPVSDPLHLWRRAVVVNCILLFPIAAVLLCYAEPLVVTVFGEAFRPAALVLQIYTVVIVRECFDFSPPLRAVNRTRPLAYSNAIALVVNVGCLLAFLPHGGIAGAGLALAISNYADGAYLAWCVSRQYNVPARALLPWDPVLKVGAAAIAAMAVIVSPIWIQWMGFAGVILGTVVYLACFVLLLRLLKVEEALLLLERIAGLLRRSRA